MRFKHREARRQTADTEGSHHHTSDQHSTNRVVTQPGQAKNEAPADQKKRLVAAAMARARARQNRRGEKS
jgi:hypothetical protein